MRSVQKKNRNGKFPVPALTVKKTYDFLQHFAQPAASPQQAAHLAASLQQEPSQAVDLLVEQPVVNIRLVASIAANIIIVFIDCFIFGNRDVLTLPLPGAGCNCL